MLDQVLEKPRRRMEIQTPSDAMVELGRLTGVLSEVIPPGATVGYVDYPMHMNVGDLLIFMGTMDFFRANGNRVETSFCAFDASPRAYARLAACDVIVCHGGGNFGDLYPRHQDLREAVVTRFPEKPVVVMPQTFHFASEAAMRQSAKLFRAHSDLTICARDSYSAALAQDHFADRVMLVPDMAHRLYASFAPLRHEAGSTAQPFLLLRRDIEADNGAADKGRDWKDLVPLHGKGRIGAHRLAAILAGKLDMPVPGLVAAHERVVDPLVRSLAARLVHHRRWITSRLHGAILGLLLDREVELLDNSYGKNSRYFTQWGSRLTNLTLG